MMPTTPPVFLVGSGRCGSTISYSLLAMHPDMGWLSSWVGSSPARVFLSVANRMWNMSAMDWHRNRRFLPKPIEAATFLGEFSFRPIAETVALLR